MYSVFASNCLRQGFIGFNDTTNYNINTETCCLVAKTTLVLLFVSVPEQCTIHPSVYLSSDSDESDLVYFSYYVTHYVSPSYSSQEPQPIWQIHFYIT